MSHRDLRVVRVFIGSPGGLEKERREFFETIDLVNTIKARTLGLLLEAVGWEDTLPGRGRPQAIINEELKTCDLVILTVWRRWGSPTGAYSSGFEEEYAVAHEANKDIQLYFKSVSKDRLADPGDQLKRVLAFRKRIEAERNYLYDTYADGEWRQTLLVNLCAWLDGWDEDDAKPTLPPGPHPARQRELERQIEALQRELEALKSEQGQEVARLAQRAHGYAQRGELTKAEILFAELADEETNPDVLNQLGLFYRQTGDLDGARSTFEQMARVAEAEQDPEAQAIAYGNLGLVLRTRGDLSGAEAMHRKALTLNEQLGRVEGMASQYGNLGLVLRTRGDLDGAEAMHRKSLELDQQLNRLEGMASDYGNLGLVLRARGDLDGAEAMHRKALAIEEQLGREEGMARDFGNLGLVMKARGDLDGAEEMHRKSLELSTQLGRLEGMASQYGNLGNVLLERGDLTGAETMYVKSLGIDDKIGRVEGIAATKKNLGIVHQDRNDSNAARAAWTVAVGVYERLGNHAKAEELRSWLSQLDDDPDA
ncbi:MAG: tetratricopeptide repeat protein [Bacteroidota bacterium]